MLLTSLGQRIVIRCKRKPIWMPTAPSKLFRIAEHKFYDKEEIEQIQALRDAWNVQMQSIGKFMEKKFYIPATQSGGIPPEFIEKESIEDEKIYAENDRINQEIAKQREQFFENKLKNFEEKVMEEKLTREEELIVAAQKIDEYIKKQKSDPESFVTPENIEQIIEKALENPISYEFCIDKSNNKRVN